MISLAEQDRLARKGWGNKLVKTKWQDWEDRKIMSSNDLSDYLIAEKIHRLPSAVRKRRLKLEREQAVHNYPSKRLRESLKAKQVEKLDAERRDAYVKKVVEDAPPLAGFKRALVEKALNAQSPFDSIKRVGEDGTEYWSARDLMPLMGYAHRGAWQRFDESVISRAKRAASNQGMQVDNLFIGSYEKTGGRPREDFKLTRYAAYLVAMNGDPNKPEVAAAQHYFAVQTRVAETQTPALALPQDYASALRELANTVEAKELAEKRAQEQAELAAKHALEIEAQAPAVEKAAAHTASDDTKGRQAFAREVQQWGMRKGVGIKQKSVYDLLRRRGMLIAEGRHDSNNPTEIGRAHV